MIAYIKRRSTFATYLHINISTYNVALNSIYDDQSILMAIGEIDIDAEDFLIFGDFIGIIKTITPGEEDTTEIVCDSILHAFKRNLVYPTPPATIEAFINSEMTAHYKSVSDATYDMPYLSITSTDATSFITPDVEEGMYNLKSYIAKVRRTKNIFVSFTLSGDTLLVNIAEVTPTIYNIIMDDGKHELITQSIANSSIAKITSLQSSTTKYWYLQADGSITNSPPIPRLEGAWIGITIDAAATDTEVVADEFAKNSKSHKIEFRSMEEYDFYGTVNLRIKETVLTSYISLIRIDDDARYLYKTGELQVTFTDKQKELT